MSRGSIFDPEGWSTEDDGSRYMPRPGADSSIPPDVTDGKVSEEEAADLERLAAANEETEGQAEEEETSKTDPDAVE